MKNRYFIEAEYRAGRLMMEGTATEAPTRRADAAPESLKGGVAGVMESRRADASRK